MRRRPAGAAGDARRRAAVALLVVAAALSAWAAVAALRARSDVVRARSRVAAARATGDAEAGRAGLRAARSDLRRARRTLREPGPAALAAMPLVGRSLVALDHTAAAALAAVEAGEAILDAVGMTPLLDAGRLDLDRLAAVRRTLAGQAVRVRAPVSRLDRLRTGWTPPQVGRGVRDARTELSGLPAALDRAAAGLDALVAIAGGERPRRLLVVLQNNAELRGTGGLVSVFAEATARGGRIEPGRFRDVLEVAESARHADRVPAPPGVEARYGRYLAATTLWRNANMPPDVPTSAQVLAALAERTLGRRPDVVVLLDVRAIGAVLDATGPARLPDGRRLDGATAVDELLVRAYADVPDTRAGQDARRRRLRATADATVERLLSGAAGPLALATALGEAAAGRHVAVWSADPAEQQALEALGVSGRVRTDTTDLAMATVQNFGGGGGEGNKLDYYARRRFSVRTEIGPDFAVTTQRLELRNTAPASGLPRYVAGLEHPGELRGLLTFALPASATVEEFTRDGQGVRTALDPENGHLVVEDVLTMPAGTATTWILRYRVPVRGGRYSLRLVPQPLAVDARLDVTVTAAPGTGTVLRGDRTWSGAWDRERVVGVAVRRAGWWGRMRDGLRRWWSEPVRFGLSGPDRRAPARPSGAGS